MQARPAQPSPYFLPSKALVEPIPRGVVGIIAPWNYPVNLALAPLAGCAGGGKPRAAQALGAAPRGPRSCSAHALRERFTAEEIAVVEGGPDVAAAVTKLPLDHLLFTGSTNVGKKVASAAAENLVPTTLELGGKSPALVHSNYSIAKARLGASRWASSSTPARPASRPTTRSFPRAARTSSPTPSATRRSLRIPSCRAARTTPPS